MTIAKVDCYGLLHEGTLARSSITLVHQILSAPLLRQYLNFCTCKARKLPASIKLVHQILRASRKVARQVLQVIHKRWRIHSVPRCAASASAFVLVY